MFLQSVAIMLKSLPLIESDRQKYLNIISNHYDETMIVCVNRPVLYRD